MLIDNEKWNAATPEIKMKFCKEADRLVTHNGYTKADFLLMVRFLIKQVEQKGPCTPEQLEAVKWLKDNKKCCTGCDYESTETDTVPCCICSRLLDDEFRTIKPLSKGYIIRESNNGSEVKHDRTNFK